MKMPKPGESMLPEVTGFLRNDAPAREHETTAEQYARQTRNAAVFVAVVIGLGVIISVIMGMAAIAAIHGIPG